MFFNQGLLIGLQNPDNFHSQLPFLLFTSELATKMHEPENCFHFQIQVLDEFQLEEACEHIAGWICIIVLSLYITEILSLCLFGKVWKYNTYISEYLEAYWRATRWFWLFTIFFNSLPLMYNIKSHWPLTFSDLHGSQFWTRTPLLIRRNLDAQSKLPPLPNAVFCSPSLRFYSLNMSPL